MDMEKKIEVPLSHSMPQMCAIPRRTLWKFASVSGGFEKENIKTISDPRIKCSKENKNISKHLDIEFFPIYTVFSFDIHKCRERGRLGKAHHYSYFIDDKKILRGLNELLEVAQHNLSEPML